MLLDTGVNDVHRAVVMRSKIASMTLVAGSARSTVNSCVTDVYDYPALTAGVG